MKNKNQNQSSRNEEIFSWKKNQNKGFEPKKKLEKFKEFLKLKKQKTKIFIQDHWHLIFKSSAENHLRIQQCRSSKEKQPCDLEFGSYSELKRYQKKVRLFTYSFSSTLVSVFIVVIVLQVFFGVWSSKSASFGWVQTSWNGAEDISATANHDSDKAGWTGIYSKDGNVDVTNDEAKIVAISGSAVDTTEANFNTATNKNNVYVDATGGGAFTLKKPEGTDCTDAIQCKSGLCLNNVCCKDACCGVTTTSANGITYGTVVAGDGKCWLDRNLGATSVATARNTQAAYGWLFQWGRKADGHQYTAWGGQPNPALSDKIQAYSTTSTVSPPNDVKFLTFTALGFYDWLNPPVDTLWSGVSSVNNPCPTGFRVPTQPEWATVVSASPAITNYTTAASNPLHLPSAGYRDWGAAAALSTQGDLGRYWSSSSLSQNVYITSSSINPSAASYRLSGYSVRCIKN